jgi:hypothetical protein
MFDSESVVDNVSDLSVTVAGCYEDPTVVDALREMYECEAEITEADVEDMHRAAEEAAADDGLDAAPFHDLSPARYAAIIRMMPAGTGWNPETTYDANDDLPFRAQLRRGTPNGPDMIRLGRFSTAENALTCAVLFLLNMVLIDKGHGDDATRAAIVAQIEYAKR